MVRFPRDSTIQPERGSIIRSLMRSVWNSPVHTSWANISIRMGGLVLLLPIVLTKLSAPEVLVWQMFASITMLIVLADFGFNPTFARFIAFARGGGSLAELKGGHGLDAPAPEQVPLKLEALLSTQAIVYRRLILCAMFVTAILGTLTLWGPVGQLEVPLYGWAAWGLSAVSAQFTLLSGANVSVLTGFEKIQLVQRTQALVSLAQLGSTCLVALAGGGLLMIVGCYSIWSIIQHFLIRQRVRWLDLDFQSIAAQPRDRELMHTVWQAGWRSGIGILMSTGLVQASGLVYAQIATVGEAASYLLALRAFLAVSQIAQVPFYTRLPTMAHARGRNAGEDVAHIARRGMQMALWIFVAGAVAILIVAQPLLELIGSSVNWPSETVAILLALALFVERYGAMHVQIYSLTNHIIWHVLNGVTGVVMIALFVILFPAIGLPAMPLAMLGANLGCYARYASRYSFKSLGLPRWPFERATILGPAVILVSASVAIWTFRQ